MWDKPEIMLWLADLLYALAAILLLYAVLFVVVHLPVFPVKEIKVMGELKHVTRQQVQYIVNRELAGNFFTVDLNRTRQAFEKLPWVRNVNIRRKWPDKLEVSLEEHVALARWGTMALVNTHGELFDGATDQELPVFVGPAENTVEMAQYYAQFQQMLKPTGLAINQLVLTPRRAWELRFNNGLVAELGREKVSERLQRFAGVYGRTLERLGGTVSYVDLRYSNGFAVRMQGFREKGSGAGADKAALKKAA
jgi:cell division protein FtsQ